MATIRIVVVAPARRGQQHAGADQRGEIMRDVHLAARILQARRHPGHDAAPFQDLPQQHRAAGSPVSRSARQSMRSERLNAGMTACNVSPMRASDAAAGFCLVA